MPSAAESRQIKFKHRCRLKKWLACIVPVYATASFVWFTGKAAIIDHSAPPIGAGLPPSSSGRSGPFSPFNEEASLSGEAAPRGVPSHYRSAARAIAAKWNLTSPAAPSLLERQFHRADDYDPETDFLYFHHVHKTGGTTVSDVLNATLGALVHGRGGIFPGSQRSGRFSTKIFNASTGGNADGAASRPYVSSYSHASLRPVHGPNKTKLAEIFEGYLAPRRNPRRRLRSLGMLREPTDLRASAHAMSMCALNKLVAGINGRRGKAGLDPICTPEEGLNVSQLVDGAVDAALSKCPDTGKSLRRLNLSRYEKSVCQRGKSGLDYCRSPTHLLSSPEYQHELRSLLRNVMGRYTAREPLGVDRKYDVEENAKKIGLGFLDRVEEYTLMDLGGLDLNATHAQDGYHINGQLISNGSDRPGMDLLEPDFLWFGITERMEESMCLLYYTLRVKPLAKTPRARVMHCPPTSWWTEHHREAIKRREPADYAVWRAANAILDVRLTKMQIEVNEKLGAGRTLLRGERDQYKALADAGCLNL